MSKEESSENKDVLSTITYNNLLTMRRIINVYTPMQIPTHREH